MKRLIILKRLKTHRIIKILRKDIQKKLRKRKRERKENQKNERTHLLCSRNYYKQFARHKQRPGKEGRSINRPVPGKSFKRASLSPRRLGRIASGVQRVHGVEKCQSQRDPGRTTIRVPRENCRARSAEASLFRERRSGRLADCSGLASDPANDHNNHCHNSSNDFIRAALLKSNIHKFRP
ncbi:hypothetical protein BpHYR1_009569 [Brachionus plicatilis]|uniref:Uncharacterized protein n=1 Tax=Brachionus plicatilis TaxID=10195 RepID=A0A3M7T8E1_BRAPC|nr:hypothetical protein BpHYR1_009569 [Brachionus plicatilis]